MIFSSYYGIIIFNKLDKSGRKVALTMSNFDKLMEEIRKTKFSGYSDEELDKLLSLLDNKIAEIKFVKRARRIHKP